ncbi:hypothetical protein [Alkalihalobacterium chitinilyticum]|uniref:Uncharacterized protein n=1 Tax=Alkalihalobacterium chitinilyticum TaxID=2980103 RepID=A0ABT5VES5_9BACI|nr:hypothetical protein [Alkalihalobacterium chitinilyticum]MDE5413959.1 hypothetical protein [Alkalihalobacterium chitinilyticum]
MESFTFFILGLLVLVSAAIISVICIVKKKSFIIPVILLAVGFILGFIGLFNMDHVERDYYSLGIITETLIGGKLF